MSPCSPSDVSISIPDGPSGPAIPGFGIPFSLELPTDLFPEGFPEDLLALLDLLQLLIPSGPLLPQLSISFGQGIFDAILKLLDQFMPFLMLYKFFLPILNLIICIIEVLCAIPNPFKVINALIKLFRDCIPAFLNLFPIFALIIMIISLILLLIALVQYIILQILKLIELIIKNILALVKAIELADASSIIAIAKKLGASLCIFQNFFVLLAIFNIIIQIIRDILSLAFAIPPCEADDPEGCCTTDVCPSIVKNGDYTRTTGTLQYLSAVGASNTIPGLPPPFDVLFIGVRQESWQIWDPFQTQEQQFINIFNAYDVPGIVGLTKPIFFPLDAVYGPTTPAKQAPYKVDVKLYYTPSAWGRTGTPRYIIFKDCSVIKLVSPAISNFNNVDISMPSGVLSIVGGTGYEEDGVTAMQGFAEDGVTPISDTATLNNFLHKPSVTDSSPSLLPSDAVTFNDIEYTFKPNIPVLVGKNLVTAGCAPELADNKAFINSVFAGDIAIKLELLRNVINGPDFPNPKETQDCLTAAVNTLRNNLTLEGVSEFQATSLNCLNKLQDNCVKTLGEVIGIGFEPCNSDFSLEPTLQFTSQPIKVKVDLKERNGIPLTTGIPASVGAELASRIKGYPTIGQISNFEFDGYQSFTANLTSLIAGSGSITISFDNNIFCRNNIPADINLPATHELQTLDYEFILTPVGTGTSSTVVGEGDTSDGAPRRDGGDISGNDTTSKDGV